MHQSQQIRPSPPPPRIAFKSQLSRVLMFAHNKGVRSYVKYRKRIILGVFRVHIIDAVGAASEVLKAVQQTLL